MALTLFCRAMDNGGAMDECDIVDADCMNDVTAMWYDSSDINGTPEKKDFTEAFDCSIEGCGQFYGNTVSVFC